MILYDEVKFNTNEYISNLKQYAKNEVYSELLSSLSKNSNHLNLVTEILTTKLNQFVTRTRKNQQQSSYYAAGTTVETPSEDLYTYDDNESVTAETRF